MKLEVRVKGQVRRWYYDFTLRGKRYRGWLLPAEEITKRSANSAVNKIKAKILSERFPISGKGSTGKKLIKEIFKNYEEYLKNFRPRSYYGKTEYMFKKFKFFTRWNKITRSTITRYQKMRLRQKVCGTTVNRELNFCEAAFNRAIRNGLIDYNPFSGFDKFEEVQRTRFLSEGELVRLLDASSGLQGRSPHLKDIILTAILTGLRRSAILELHSDEINFGLGIITKKPGQSTQNKRNGEVPIPDDLVSTLKEKIKMSVSGYVFENMCTRKPMNNVKKAFDKAKKNAGIEDFRFHDLRHTFATYALVRSKDVRGVQEILGHRDVKTTMKYVHILANQKVGIVNAVGEFVSDLLNRNSKGKL